MAIVAISGYSTAGKTYTAQALPELQFCQLTSVTTREVRPGEFPGLDYDYISDSDFQGLIENQEFVEHVSYCGYHYGLKKSVLQNILGRGLIPCHVCTPTGVEALQNYASAHNELFISAFIEADFSTIIFRMMKRWQTMPYIDTSYLADRIATAISTESRWTGDYHFIIENSDELIPTAQRILDCCTGKIPLPKPVFREPRQLTWSYENILSKVQSFLETHNRPVNIEASRNITSGLIINLFHS